MTRGDAMFIGLAALTVASPGPGGLMTLDDAVQRGWRASMHGHALPIGVHCALLRRIHAAYAGAAARSRRWLARERTTGWLARVSAATFLGLALAVLVP